MEDRVGRTTAQATAKASMQRTSISIPDSIDAQVRKQIEKHGAGSLSEYVTGLVCLDVLLSAAGPTELKDVPLWVVRSFKLDVREGKIEKVQLMKAENDLDMFKLQQNKPPRKKT
jgi:hypothetical protein